VVVAANGNGNARKWPKKESNNQLEVAVVTVASSGDFSKWWTIKK